MNTVPRQHVNVLAAVRVLLRAGVNINARTNQGETALHFGAQLSKAIVDDLLAAGADVTAVTVQGSNALAFAVRRPRFDVARSLLTAGASPNSNTSSSCAAPHTAHYADTQ